MDYSTLKALKPSEYGDAADGYRALARMASAAKEHIDKQVAAGLREAVEGVAADAALRQLRALSENFHYVHAECGLVSTALNGFSFDMEAAKKKLDAAIADAEAEGFSVGKDGSVTYPAGEKKVDGEYPKGGTAKGVTDPTAQSVNRQAANFDPNPHYRRAQEYADRIAAALEEATEADEKWSPKLQALRADDDLTVSGRDWVDVKQDNRGVLKGAQDYLDSIKHPPEHGTPKENAEWWKGLSDEERADYIAVHPASVGAMDGLPATVRDQANRTVLSEAHGAEQEKVNAWLAKNPEPPRYQSRTGLLASVTREETLAWKKWNEQREEIEGPLRGMEAIQQRFDKTGVEGLPEAYLLGFDTKGNGHAIVATGNPDSAEHTAVYVPGTESKLAGAEGDIRRMTDLWGEASGMPGGENVSTVTWIGYDAPQSVVPEAMERHWAHEGAPKLNHFLYGLQTVQGGPGASHITVIGHSYGSTVVGAASEQGDMAADDIVVAGSPGMLVPEADDLDVGRDHVWSEAAGNDNVPAGGKMAGLGGQQPIDRAHDMPPYSGHEQNVPSDRAFGAHRMRVDTEGHSGYWDRGSTSLKNQATVVVGQYDKVEEGW
ncbi:hypothetical protein C3486_07675 [Streptomyces sp. Ru73]|uniref:alpha/beta hydrolase n=1 Tax=Streptomyces sp. Ru73 TaxID=2080748 RepID=UPI000CDD1443|nr:alpha/beta hydrolase [Streptomyces sp. Ru73]POX41813.1 hypothetical protein C3486_07675 [Streptomyces sp. Ru73]